MKCKNCGLLIKGNKKFCTNCGFKIEIDSQQISEEIKTTEVNQNKTSSLKVNNKKTNGALLPFFGILLFSLIAAIIYNSYDENNNYDTSYEWVDEYLETNGECCNEKFYSIKTNKDKLLVINDIVAKNPNDRAALREQNILNRYLRREENQNSLKTYGNYSVYLNSTFLDINHFKEYGEITYEVEVTRKGKPLKDPFSFNCRTQERYFWNQSKWKVPRNKNENSIIKDICLRQKNVSRIMKLLENNGWKKYSNNSWVDINRWEESSGRNYLNYDTNFFMPSKQVFNKVSVNCKRKEISFRKGAKDWTDWAIPKFEEKEIVNDKCGF